VRDFSSSVDSQEDEILLENCDGLEGYESPYQGDGLRCYYFNNENFMGKAVTKIEPTIDFDWGQ